jgi:acyl dehydratase
MVTRRLTSSPRALPLYLRAAAPLLPGASLLPGIAGGGGEIPRLELTLPQVEIERDRLLAYERVCGFTDSPTLPVTYPHILAFPLQMALMADGSFPFAAVGLVHVENEITQHQALRPSDRLSLAVRATALQPHPRGHTFAILTRARVGDELAWEERSTMLRRDGEPAGGSAAEHEPAEDVGDRRGPDGVEWHVSADTGRRYAAVSGDRNPIHTHAIGAKLFGFPRAIAHGMWTLARCLAPLTGELPEAFTVAVRFRKPVLLPADVSFLADRDGTSVRFALRGAARWEPHLSGRVERPSADAPPGASA